MEDVSGSPVLGSITFLSGPMKESTFQISKPRTLIGRDPDKSDIVITDPFVSRQHIQLIWRNGLCNVESLTQTNVVTINGSIVQQAVLNDDDIVGLGVDTQFRFLGGSGVQQLSEPSSVDLGQNTTPLVALQRTEQDQFDTQIMPVLGSGIPSLEVSTNTKQKKQSYPLTKQIINVGRDPTNEIVIKEPVVSNFHVQIVRGGDQLIIVHPHPARRQTLKGLLYRGRYIQGEESFQKPLIHGDIFRIGDEDGTLVTLAYNDGTGTQQEMLVPLKPIKLDMNELTIGRVEGNTVMLPHPQVSAHHARMVREGGTFRILDTNSTNHVYVNSELVTSQPLKLGDEIRIGPYKLVYDGNELKQYDESNFIRIDALNLKKTGNNNVTLLNNLSFSVPPRTFVVLVGGSGAGKSTLMDALNGLRPAQDGKVLYNGQDYYRNLAAFSTQLGYVPQDDIVHRELTVERALYYAAKLRLPSDFTTAQINQRIDEVLEDVELTARRTLLIKKLSGGQRKRVSIALELLANPSVFFLDEPTSGLDPGLDRKMMYLLRKLADKGHTIVLVTHATNNINVCDFVCILAQGGRLAYFGPPEEAKIYFGRYDFAEIYTSLEPTEENRNIPEEAEARFKLSSDYQKYVVEPLNQGPAGRANALDALPVKVKPSRRSNPWKQFLLLSQRSLESIRNNSSNLIFFPLQVLIIALIMMFIVRSAIGTGIFDPDKVVQCAPHIFQSTVATTPTDFPDDSPQLLGIHTHGKNDPVDCNRIVTFLKTDTEGQEYVTKKGKGDLNTALQDFIVPGESIDVQRTLFSIAFVAMLFGYIHGMREIVKEESIYRRERTVNLGIVPYVLSKIFVLGLLALFQSATLVLIVNAFEPLHQGIFLPILLETYITLVLTTFAGWMMGLMVSAFAANEDFANSLLLFILIPQVIFSGIIFPLDGWLLQFLGLLSLVRWAMAGIGSSIGLHGDKLGEDRLFGDDYAYHGTLFSTFSQADATRHLLLVWTVLTMMIVFFGCMTAYALKRKDLPLIH